MKYPNLPRAACLLLIVALLGSACGGDDQSDGAEDTGDCSQDVFSEPERALPQNFPADLALPPCSRPVEVGEPLDPSNIPTRVVFQLGVGFEEAIEEFRDSLSGLNATIDELDRRDAASRTADELDPYFTFLIRTPNWQAAIAFQDAARYHGPATRAIYDYIFPPGELPHFP